jgi:hypothetical protein
VSIAKALSNGSWVAFPQNHDDMQCAGGDLRRMGGLTQAKLAKNAGCSVELVFALLTLLPPDALDDDAQWPGGPDPSRTLYNGALGSQKVNTATKRFQRFKRDGVLASLSLVQGLGRQNPELPLVQIQSVHRRLILVRQHSKT